MIRKDSEHASDRDTQPGRTSGRGVNAGKERQPKQDDGQRQEQAFEREQAFDSADRNCANLAEPRKFVPPRVCSYPDRVGIHDPMPLGDCSNDAAWKASDSLEGDSSVESIDTEQLVRRQLSSDSLERDSSDSGGLKSRKGPNYSGQQPLQSKPSKAGHSRGEAVSDEALIAGIAVGARDAFVAFYDRHAPKILGWLIRLLGNQSEAEDILQETFWQSWETASSYDPDRAKPAAWLMMIARSRAYDHLRRKRRRESTQQEQVVLPLRGSIEELESRQLTRCALDQLPDDQRSAIGMAFYFGLSHQQIAERQDIPLGTVKTRIRRGMQTMRAFLLGHERDAASGECAL